MESRGLYRPPHLSIHRPNRYSCDHAHPTRKPPQVKSHALLIEALWIGLAAALAAGLCLPPYLKFGPYLYAAEIAGSVFLLATLARLLLFSHQAPWLSPRYMKGVLSILSVPIFLFAVLTLNNVQTLVDAEGLDAIFVYASGEEAVQWGTYLRDLTVFACAGTFIGAVALPVVLIVRLWRQVKEQARTKFSRKRAAATR